MFDIDDRFLKQRKAENLESYYRGRDIARQREDERIKQEHSRDMERALLKNVNASPWSHMPGASEEFKREFFSNCLYRSSDNRPDFGWKSVKTVIKVPALNREWRLELGAPDPEKPPYLHTEASLAMLLHVRPDCVELWVKQPGTEERVRVRSVNIGCKDKDVLEIVLTKSVLHG